MRPVILAIGSRPHKSTCSSIYSCRQVLKIQTFRSMSSFTRKRASTGGREFEICENITSQLRKEAQHGEQSPHTSHEQRTAADLRQKSIHNVYISNVLDQYDNIRLIRLKLQVTPEMDLKHNSEQPGNPEANDASALQWMLEVLQCKYQLIPHINSSIFTWPVARRPHSRPSPSCTSVALLFP